MSSDSSFLDNGARPGANFWQRCLECLREECTTKQFDTWLRPVQEVVAGDGEVTLLAPNDFVLEYLQEHFWDRIETIFKDLGYGAAISLKVGSKAALEAAKNEGEVSNDYAALVEKKTTSASGVRSTSVRRNFLNSTFTFENFIEGKSNQLAKAAALQTAVSPGKAYNPLFIYGGVGLGKTHLMHAVGNEILRQQKGARVLYLHSERFVSDMIKSLQHNSINEFKNFYRSLDALLIDDIQFFAGKERSQEELFHTFNSLLDESHQIILTCDRYPKEIEGLDERLKSRFGWGLAVAIEPPELETRVAILISKAKSYHANLSEDVAFFIAKHVQSNVRELEGALKKIIATASFLGSEITIDIVQDSLKDLLTAQARQITIANIQKTVAAYYKIRITDLTSKNRSRNVARPRQMAMTITKELTDHSLPEIADAFGGRDHTTVIHAQRTIKKLITTNAALNEDYKNLIRALSS